MAKQDDEFDFLDGVPSDTGGRLSGVLFIIVGTILFIASALYMVDGIFTGLSTGQLNQFFSKFAFVAITGMPVFIIGVWLFKRGRRLRKGKE